MASRKLGPEFTYDLSEFRRVDPDLIHYEQSAAVGTGLKEPRGIAVGPEDRLYVAGDRAVRVFGSDGRAAGDWATQMDPRCVAVAPAGTVYVAAADHVEAFAADGRRETAWKPAGQPSLITGLAAADGDVFASDAAACAVWHYSAAGELLGRIDGRPAPAAAAKDAGGPGFIVPSPYFDVAVGPAGVLLVANPGRRRVELYTYDGIFKSSWGAASFKIEGFCGCCNPTHLSALPGGRIVTSEKGLPRVKVYAPEGRLASVVAPPAAFDEAAAGLDVAADSAGRIWVLDPLARQVRLFTRKKTAPAEAKP
ncbi:MAG: hypothetical protein FJ288_01445 [Planctomycetes bacterium]|nr:hypothetical protein [Planctomycetota bacterium]